MFPEGMGVPLYVTVPVIVALEPQPTAESARPTIKNKINIRFMISGSRIPLASGGVDKPPVKCNRDVATPWLLEAKSFVTNPGRVHRRHWALQRTTKFAG